MPMIFDWTPDAVATLQRMRGAGNSAAQIAVELGCTKNAVLGKAMRLGLGNERPQPARARRPRGEKREPVLLLDEILALDAGAGVPAYCLRMCHCRWIERVEPPWVFCGAAAQRGSYCEEHAARVFYKPRRDET